MSTSTAKSSTVKPKAMIQDNTRCIGCRACMVACKEWNDRPDDKTDFFAGAGYQNPRDLDANNYTLITFNEIVDGPNPDWVFRRHQLRRPRRYGYRSEAADRGRAGHLHSGDLRSRRSRRHQCAAPFIRAIREDRLHYRPAENADARPHAQMAAHDGACLCCVIR